MFSKTPVYPQKSHVIFFHFYILLIYCKNELNITEMKTVIAKTKDSGHVKKFL
jgi:hypothetical protein